VELTKQLVATCCFSVAIADAPLKRGAVEAPTKKTKRKKLMQVMI
jgi:hypothetical protein